MAFFTSVSASIIAPAEETTTAEGVDVFEIKGICTACQPGIPVVMLADRDSDHGKFLRDLAAKTKEGETLRVLVSGILQPVLAEKAADKSITKPPKIKVFVGSARRLRADVKIDPEQAIVFGSGFATPVTDYEDDTKRKAEIFLSAGTENLTEEGAYCSRLQVIGDATAKTDALCLTVDDGREVYVMGNLWRSAGTVGDTQYDKLKLSSTFIQETDRVKSRGKGPRKPKSVSMSSQLSSDFEGTDSPATKMSAAELAQQAAVALSDF